MSSLSFVIERRTDNLGKDINGKELGRGLSQKKNGLYCARLTLRNGMRKEKYFHDLNEAKDWLIVAKYDNLHGNIYAGGDMKLNVWYNYWINNIRGDNIRARTRSAYDNSFYKCIDPYIGNLPLSEIKQMHCQNVVNQEQSRGIGESYAKHLIMVMNMLFASAVENDILPVHPIKSKLQYKRDVKKERRVLTVQEQKDFLEIAKRYAYYDVFCLALQTGMRFGELAGLYWSDIDFQNRTIHVQRSMFSRKIGDYIINPPKTMAGDRYIPLTEKAVEILKRVKNKKHKKIIAIDCANYVFLNRNGHPLKLDDCDGTLRRLADANHMERLSMHSLRHTFATRAIESGMKPKILQKILGHSQISMTLDLYVHATKDEIEKEMKLFEKIG